MLNFISNHQIRQADEYTIQHLPIRSIDLMEQASAAFVKKFTEYVSDEEKIAVCCGTGNNGGDGLAIARLLRLKGYKNVKVIVVNVFQSASEDFKINKERLIQLKIPLIEIKNATELPDDLNIVVDAILGSGFRGTTDKVLSDIIHKINQQANYIFSVDCPSGLNVDAPEIENYEGIRANKTISFQRPKLFFMLPESVVCSQSSEFVEIGLDENFIQSLPSNHFWIEEQDTIEKLKLRKTFSHKGTYGHLLIIAGAPNTMGAALLCAKAGLFSGTGMVTCCFPKEYFSTINTFQPEIMTWNRDDFDAVPFEKFNVVAIGPGLGTAQNSREMVQKILKIKIPTVFDADALNILAEVGDLSKIPPDSILTPHLKEFDRLFGISESWTDRLEKARQKAQELHCIIVLKNQYTFICDTNGKVYVNSSGNPSMAQAGMGDVLTGCIASFLAQGYKPLDAAIVGCYVHGAAGDTLGRLYGVTPASMIAVQISKTLKVLIHQKKM